MLSFFLTSMIGDRLHCIRLINALSTLSNLRYDILSDALPISIKIPIEGKKQIKFFVKDGRSVAMYSTTIGFADMIIR